MTDLIAYDTYQPIDYEHWTRCVRPWAHRTFCARCNRIWNPSDHHLSGSDFWSGICGKCGHSQRTVLCRHVKLIEKIEKKWYQFWIRPKVSYRWEFK